MNKANPDKESVLADHSSTKPDTGRKVKVFALIVSVTLIIGFLVVRHMKSVYQIDLADAAFKEASAPPAVDVITVQNAPTSFSLTLPGETAAWYESTIYSRVDGYVANWKVDIGDHVKKGQVLATIETPDLDARLMAAMAKVKASQAVVVARQADADFAKTTYARWKDSPKGVVSEQERDAKKAGYDYAVAHLNQAKAQVGLDQAVVDQYSALTQFKQVVAPYTGTITERHIDIGNLVSSANTTPLYRMVKDDPIRVVVFVPQSAAGDIKLGSTVRIEPGNGQDREFTGKISRTANSISPQTRTLRVEADIANPDHSLVPGMYVNVNFQVPTEGLVEVPAAALVFRSGGPEVCSVGKDGRITFRKVTIGRDNGNIVELASGISKGETVALNISNQIIDGDAVDAHEIGEIPADGHKAEK
ncbi:Efflux transporter, RND family, MFP subunit [Syntrophobacter sp. SbD1]|nr:Efflux transporter, RND family, MFP subunit [Syntrophobacter sp. SbD1]